MQFDFEKVLTTGANGMVGSYVDFGVRTNHSSLDVTDLKEVLTLCRKHKPKVILHLAAETDVDRCERDPEHAYMTNSIGTYNVVVAAREVGAKLVYVSTAGIFDGKKEGLYTEEDVPNPFNHYSHSKYLGELAVRGTLKDFIIARADCMFGGGPSIDRKLVGKIVDQFGKPEIFGIKDNLNSPTFGKDLVAAIKRLIADDATGIFHLGNRGACSTYEFVREIVATLRPDITVTPVDSSFFKLDAARWTNKGMVSKVDLMRPWQEALREYLETEWKPVLR
jgi:dTDP-4-dehydrorhamnose reductase